MRSKGAFNRVRACERKKCVPLLSGMSNQDLINYRAPPESILGGLDNLSRSPSWQGPNSVAFVNSDGRLVSNQSTELLTTLGRHNCRQMNTYHTQTIVL